MPQSHCPTLFPRCKHHELKVPSNCLLCCFPQTSPLLSFSKRRGCFKLTPLGGGSRCPALFHLGAHRSPASTTLCFLEPISSSESPRGSRRPPHGVPTSVSHPQPSLSRPSPSPSVPPTVTCPSFPGLLRATPRPVHSHTHSCPPSSHPFFAHLLPSRSVTPASLSTFPTKYTCFSSPAANPFPYTPTESHGLAFILFLIIS